MPLHRMPAVPRCQSPGGMNACERTWTLSDADASSGVNSRTGCQSRAGLAYLIADHDAALDHLASVGPRPGYG